MEHIKQTANRALNHSTGKAITTGATLTQRDVVIIDRFYSQIAEIYGHKFRSMFADDDDLDRNKRVWSKQIAAVEPHKLAQILETIKSTGIPEWPDMGQILKTNTSASPTGMNAAAYAPYRHPKPASATKVQKAEQKARGLEKLAMLRKSMDMPPASDATRASMVELEQIFDSVGAEI